MGEVLAAYGVRGWIKIRPFTASPDGLVPHRTWWLRKGAAWQAFPVAEVRRHGDAVAARLEGFATREDAAPWRGAEVAVPRSALPVAETGQVYLADLEGLAVVNRRGAALGHVAGCVETGVHPVLRVVEAKRRGELLIPFVPAYVDAVDLADGRIRVDWPED